MEERSWDAGRDNRQQDTNQYNRHGQLNSQFGRAHISFNQEVSSLMRKCCQYRFPIIRIALFVLLNYADIPSFLLLNDEVAITLSQLQLFLVLVV